MNKDTSLASIFERENDGKFTKDALLFQDIFKFCIQLPERSQQEFKQRSQNGCQDRIKKKLDELVELDFIHKDITPQEKGEGLTTLYVVTTWKDK